MNLNAVNGQNISFKGVRYSPKLEKAILKGNMGYNQKRMLGVIIHHIKQNNYDRLSNVDIKFSIDSRNYKNLYVLIREKFPNKKLPFLPSFNFEPYLNASNGKVKRVFENLFRTKTKGVDLTVMDPVKPQFTPIKQISWFDKILNFFKS